MQLKIHIKNQSELLLPLNYNYQLMSAFYRLLSSDRELSRYIHSEGWRSGKASFRLFTFSPITGHYSIKEKKIAFDSDISIELRSPSQKLVNAVREELFKNGCFKLFNYMLKVNMLECYDRRFEDEDMRIRTVSPIVLSRVAADGGSIYFSPADELFDQLVNINLYKKFTAAFGAEPPSTVDLTLVGGPKKVVTMIKDTWVTAYHAEFYMHASPVVTQFLYDTGLGGRNSQGFGMFETV